MVCPFFVPYSTGMNKKVLTWMWMYRSFVCQIRDGQKRLPKILSDFGKFATYVVVERYETCYCSTPGIHARLMDKAARGPAAERMRYGFGEADDSDNGDAGEQAEAPPAYGDLT